MVFFLNKPLITKSELAKRPPIVLKPKINLEEYKLTKVTDADKMSNFIKNKSNNITYISH
jgi:hypothetical protein